MKHSAPLKHLVLTVTACGLISLAGVGSTTAGVISKSGDDYTYTASSDEYNDMALNDLNTSFTFYDRRARFTIDASASSSCTAWSAHTVYSASCDVTGSTNDSDITINLGNRDDSFYSDSEGSGRGLLTVLGGSGDDSILDNNEDASRRSVVFGGKGNDDLSVTAVTGATTNILFIASSDGARYVDTVDCGDPTNTGTQRIWRDDGDTSADWSTCEVNRVFPTIRWP